MSERKGLFSDFPPVTYAEWMEKITEDLKGADYRKKLVWKPFGDLGIDPFYRKEDIENLPFAGSLTGSYPFARGIRKSHNKWRIRQDIRVEEFVSAGEKAGRLTANGIDSAGFVITDPAMISMENTSALLAHIDPSVTELNFLSAGRAKELALSIREWAEASGYSPSELKGAIETDPLGRLVRNGTLCILPEKGFDYLYELILIMEDMPSLRAVNINASLYENSGASLVTSLAFAVSMGAEYVSQLTSRGIDPVQAASRLRFSFGTGSLYFPEIAKLRAARLLWSAVMDAYKPSDAASAGMSVHSVTSRWNKTVYDPFVNLLRTQTEVMSAIIGGADTVTAEPFDIVFRNPDEFSERLARNQQLILREESFFDRVADPSGGSYYIEKLTDTISSQAWSLFMEIEEQGGFLEAVKKGLISRMVREQAEAASKETASRKRVFIGTNKYAGTDAAGGEGYSPPDDLRTVHGETALICEPLTPQRGAEVFERIRREADRAEKRPVVFLLAAGDKKMRSARAGFSADFFGCAGYKVINNQGFDDVHQGIEEALKSNADIVVICSSDEEYASIAPAVHDRLKDVSIVVIAGNPECMDDLKSAGIEFFISLKSDAASVLGEINRKLGLEG